jgi:hypothetical protein
MDTTVLYCITLVAVAGGVLWLYGRYNQYNNVERFYYRTDRFQYGLLKAAYFVIFATFLLSIRTLIVHAFKG